MKRLAVVLAVVAVVAACGSDGDSENDQGSGDDQTAEMPAEIVAALGRRLVVLSSEDGSVVRTLVEGQGITSAAVSPDGATVYFTRPDPDVICDQGAAFQVMTVPLEGGSPEIFASGSDAVVSPDGRRIAFATGGPDQCALPTYLAIQELGTNSFSQQLLEGGNATLYPLGWSANSSRVLYSTGTIDTVEAREVEPDSGAPPRTVPLPEGGYLPAYLGDSGSLAAVQGGGEQERLVEIDAATGEIHRALFELDPRTAVRSDAADPTGRHLLVTTLTGDTGGDRILRWSSGTRPVVLLETEIGEIAADAAWVPANGG
jgi:dipeptidyl aminopeptidase/acylaminoacyl peptidase